MKAAYFELIEFEVLPCLHFVDQSELHMLNQDKHLRGFWHLYRQHWSKHRALLSQKGPLSKPAALHTHDRFSMNTEMGRVLQFLRLVNKQCSSQFRLSLPILLILLFITLKPVKNRQIIFHSNHVRDSTLK